VPAGHALLPPINTAASVAVAVSHQRMMFASSVFSAPRYHTDLAGKRNSYNGSSNTRLNSSEEHDAERASTATPHVRRNRLVRPWSGDPDVGSPRVMMPAAAVTTGNGAAAPRRQGSDWHKHRVSSVNSNEYRIVGDQVTAASHYNLHVHKDVGRSGTNPVAHDHETLQPGCGLDEAPLISSRGKQDTHEV
jgi:hypothetical protein